MRGSSTIQELIVENVGITFEQSPTIGKLTLAPSSTNIIFNGQTLTITQSLYSNTTNCTPMFSLSTPGGTGVQAKLANTSGVDITLNNANIKNINSSGTKAFIVNGIDGGANTGLITFVEPPAKTIYWVGAAGDNEWNNQANWSATSGGAGGYCLPTRYDDVIFDNNSNITGGAVKITNISASFHNITVQNNAPIFNFTSAVDMECYGSWYMRSGMTVAVNNTYFYSKNLGETITSNASKFRQVIFYGNGGWTLQDDFSTEDVATYHLYFRGGTLNTNSKKVFVGGDFVGNGTMTPSIPRSLILGASELSFMYRWLYDANINTVDAGTSHIILRDGIAFTGMNNQTYYNLTSQLLPGSSQALGIGIVQKFNDINIFNKTASINNIAQANKISAMPATGRLDFQIQNNIVTNILELQSNAIFRVTNGRIITVNQNFITHTADCHGLMEMYVNGKAAGQKFTLKALQNVNIPNVWMTGVTADISTGKTYTATGIKDTDVDNWTFTSAPAKELYWIGVSDNNWNNGVNWTTNSNGTPSAGGCVPSKFDNVHFNSYSGNGVAGLNIKIVDQSAFFNNFITHSDAPAGISITSDIYAVVANAYGNTMSLGTGMEIDYVNHYGEGTVNIVGPTTGEAQFMNLQLRTNLASQVWNIKNNISVVRRPGPYPPTPDMSYFGNLVLTNGTLNIDRASFNVQTELRVVDGVLNVPKTLTTSQLSFTKGTINAANTTINVGTFSGATANVRTLDLTNSTVNVNNWLYYNGTTANTTLISTGSRIKVAVNFSGLNGHTYNIIETAGGGVTNYLAGSLTINELILKDSRTLNASNAIGKLTMYPSTVYLKLANNTTQTITQDMSINGSPCNFNYIQAVTPSVGANINYSNASHNRFDYMKIMGINATGVNLEFDVNSSNDGNNNNKVVFLPGTPGAQGLGPNKTCVEIIATDPSTYTISAEKFYGGSTTSYSWSKKNSSGTFVNLNLPANTISIDVRNYGLDGVYKVDGVYDIEQTTPCTFTGQITVSYKPKNVVVTPEQSSVTYCANEGKKVSDLQVDPSNATEMSSRGAVLNWYSAAIGGSPLPTTTLLQTGDYYAELQVIATGCVSATRTLVHVQIDLIIPANAGKDQTRVDNLPAAFQMNANTPASGSGKWSVVSGNVTIDNPLNPQANITLNSGSAAELRWMVTNGTCVSSDTVILSLESKSSRANPSIRMRVSQ